MIFSEQWLKEWVDPKLDTQELIERLTMAGLEVDGATAVARKFTGIVVGQVETVEPHPDADKLSVCSVSDGSSKHQVVCGAPNVRAGMKVPFATVGAEIITEEGAKPFKIKTAKLRGVESNGMLCSAEELGLAESSDGLLELNDSAPVGEDVRSLLALDDISIELDLTPNRGDCLGMTGIAREVGVLTRQTVTSPQIDSVSPAITDEFPIQITAKDACPRYLGRVIKNINLNSQSPLWMQEKLRRAGLRSIDPIVDVTNYVLVELGQPMHAFDYSKLEGHIDVRMAADKEKMTLLDGKEIELSSDTLVIADSVKAVAMAGIMGGLDTSVTSETSDVFLECAFFAPLAIAGRARSFGMHTDASHRYERGVDYELQHRAMERATELLLAIVGGEAGPVTEATGNLPETRQVRLQLASVPRMLGIEIATDEVLDIFERLGFAVANQTEDAVDFEVPSFRFDVAIEADLIEEIARIFGYNNIPQTAGLGSQALVAKPEATISLSRIRRHLVSLGYQEIVTYSFIDPTLSDLVKEPAAEAISLENPISTDMSVMRTSLLPGLLAAMQYNANRQQDRLRLFESGQVFERQGEELRQRTMIAGLIAGSRLPLNWINNNELNGFYDVKGDVESLLTLGGNDAGFSFSQASLHAMHPGQCAAITDNSGSIVGHVGALHPGIQRELGLDLEVFLFELHLEKIQQGNIPRIRVLSKYPEVSRDLAIVVDESISSDQIMGCMRENAGEFLVDLGIFDVYQGDAVTKGKKSVALGLTWQHPSRTLSDEEINAIISSCVNALQEQFNANLRN